MKYKLRICEIFKLSSGITVFACKNTISLGEIIGKKVFLVSNGVIRQELLILSERQVLNPSKNQSQSLVETKDLVKLTSEEAKSGLWELAWD